MYNNKNNGNDDSAVIELFSVVISKLRNEGFHVAQVVESTPEAEGAHALW